MPNCFQLIDKTTNQPERLQTVDDKMREHFGAEPDDAHWFRSWYDIEGLGLAMGRSLDELREKMPERKDLIDWIDANYTPDAFYSHGREI